MEKKISLKTLYLIAIIAIGLVVLGVGSTYALFTASASIDNPIYIASNLSYTSDIMDTVDVTIFPGETEYVILNINNTSETSLNYVTWYINNDNDIELGVELNETAETLGCNTICNNVPTATSGLEVKVYVRNNEPNTVTITIGVSSSSSDVILANNMKIIPNQEMPPPITPLSDFMYVLGSKNTTYNTIDYYDSSSDTIVEGTLLRPITIASDEILLTKYIGSSEIVVVPDTYTVGGVTYKTVVSSCATYTTDSGDVRSGVFMNNTSITDVIFGGNVTFLSFDYNNGDADSPYRAASYLFEGCTSLVNVENISDNVDCLYYTFSGCTSLVNAPEFPDSLYYLGQAFYDCTSLKNVPEFPDALVLMVGAFSGCTSLETVPDIPASVTNMAMAFYGCTNLTGNINILSSNVSTATRIFYNTSKNITVNVPAGSTTFNTLNALTTTNGMPANVTLVEVE